MKPLYWKFLLILGTMIVAASLVVPKSLRKNTAHGAGNAVQTFVLADLSPQTSLGDEILQDEDSVITSGKVKYLPTLYRANDPMLNFAMVIRYTAEKNALSHPLNAGTRPIKSRVIELY